MICSYFPAILTTELGLWLEAFSTVWEIGINEKKISHPYIKRQGKCPGLVFKGDSCLSRVEGTLAKADLDTEVQAARIPADRDIQTAGWAQCSCSAASNNWQDPGGLSRHPQKLQVVVKLFRQDHNEKGNVVRKTITSPPCAPRSILLPLFFTLCLRD